MSTVENDIRWRGERVWNWRRYQSIGSQQRRAIRRGVSSGDPHPLCAQARRIVLRLTGVSGGCVQHAPGATHARIPAQEAKLAPYRCGIAKPGGRIADQQRLSVLIVVPGSTHVPAAESALISQNAEQADGALPGPVD